ncbi:MAG: DNA starvation/stationary phase protection protein [Anaerolineaceae bacterium]|nr:DNA starvation/stationary phase protection protein [Anaerolineaceae bacterium]
MKRDTHQVLSTKETKNKQTRINAKHIFHLSVINILNQLLSDEAALTYKTLNAHWNVTGPNFLGLHTFFDVQRKQLNIISAEILQRIQSLGNPSFGSFEEHLRNARLNELHKKNPSIKDLIEDHEIIIRFVRQDAKKCSVEYKDKITSIILRNILSAHEKMVVMLRAYEQPEMIRTRSRLTQITQ